MGKANNLKRRVSSYLGKKTDLGPRTTLLVGKIAKIEHTIVESELEALLLEANLIKKYEPQFNVRWTDGKAYPFIKITVNVAFPAVLQSRKIDDSKALFFGPFPNIGEVRHILKWVRRIFPYQSVRNHVKKHCLYFHLGLCPCPPLMSQEDIAAYRRSIRYIIQFLQGQKEVLVKTLEREMKIASKKEDFEAAASVKRQIDTIRLIARPFHMPSSYVDNPNLASDEAEKNTGSLKTVLNEYGLTVSRLSRIECYDISNIQGKEATGSMVVATNGQIDKSQYRRFKIRLKNTPDDVAMHREMLTRRLKHNEWQLPDLIVIDGGEAQVSVTTKIIAEFSLAIPIIGLAKRLEEVIIPKNLGLHLRGAKLNFQKVALPRDHRALKLLQRLRDESHRFALSYHRELRRKIFLPYPNEQKFA